MSPADGVGEAAGATLAGHATSTRSYAAPRSPAWPADRSIGVGPGAGSALTHGVRARPVALRPARPSRRQRAVRTVGLAAAVAGVSVGAAVAIRAWQAGGRPGSTAAAPVLPASPAGSRPTARPPSVVESAGVTLRQLAATRARAFATRNPVLLGGVYLPGPLLTADQALLTRLVPPGCGLVGADTTYGVLSATGDAERRVVVATATVAASRLVCAGQLRGQAAASPATVMRIELRSSNSRAWRITALQVA